MSEDNKRPSFDLKVRTRQFAVRIIRLYSALPDSTVAQTIGKQLIRSGTSVGRNTGKAAEVDRTPRSSASGAVGAPRTRRNAVLARSHGRSRSHAGRPDSKLGSRVWGTDRYLHHFRQNRKSAQPWVIHHSSFIIHRYGGSRAVKCSSPPPPGPGLATWRSSTCCALAERRRVTARCHRRRATTRRRPSASSSCSCTAGRRRSIPSTTSQCSTSDDGKELPFAPAKGTTVSKKLMKRRRGSSSSTAKRRSRSRTLFPETAKHVDDLCFLNCLHTEGQSHGQAVLKLHTGDIA